MVLMKAIPAVRNTSCFLGRLKLLKEILPPLPSFLLLLGFTPVLPLLFFQRRLVQSLCEPDCELMQDRTKLFSCCCSVNFKPGLLLYFFHWVDAHSLALALGRG